MAAWGSLLTDDSLASRCSPPRFAATQLRSATGRSWLAQRGFSPPYHALAVREAAAPAARCRKFRRGRFILTSLSRFTSLDHLVGAREHGRRNFEAERFRPL